MKSSDAIAKNIAHWDDIFASRPWGKYPPEELVRFIARTYAKRDKKGLRALEVGCGPGANLWYLAREGFAVAGIDGSRHAIAIATERLQRERVIDKDRPPDLRVGNFATLPWGGDYFDAAIDVGGITSNTTQVIRSTISEILRVLKPGAWFFGMVFGPETSGTNTGTMLEERTTENPIEGPLQGIGVVHVFTEEEIRKEFAAFSELNLDWVRRSDRNGACLFSHWLVQARK